MAKPMWSMSKQLQVGASGEALFLKHWPDAARPHGVFKGPDFVDADGRVIELKTDTYDMAATPNFFIERWSDRDTAKPGGVWQAVQKGSTCLVYLFIKNRVWFVCEDLPALCKDLDALCKDPAMRPFPIFNKAWVTEGYRVPRVALAKHFREETLSNRSKP